MTHHELRWISRLENFFFGNQILVVVFPLHNAHVLCRTKQSSFVNVPGTTLDQLLFLPATCVL